MEGGGSLPAKQGTSAGFHGILLPLVNLFRTLSPMTAKRSKEEGSFIPSVEPWI